MKFLVALFLVQCIALKAAAEPSHSGLLIKAVSENQHVVTFGNVIILDDQNDEEGFDQGLELEREARWGDRIHHIVSQSSKNANCLKVYRVITIQETLSVSEKFGKCLSNPTVDKYEDGSMDIMFDGKKTAHYTAASKLTDYQGAMEKSD